MQRISEIKVVVEGKRVIIPESQYSQMPLVSAGIENQLAADLKESLREKQEMIQELERIRGDKSWGLKVASEDWQTFKKKYLGSR